MFFKIYNHPIILFYSNLKTNSRLASNKDNKMAMLRKINIKICYPVKICQLWTPFSIRLLVLSVYCGLALIFVLLNLLWQKPIEIISVRLTSFSSGTH